MTLSTPLWPGPGSTWAGAADRPRSRRSNGEPAIITSPLGLTPAVVDHGWSAAHRNLAIPDPVDALGGLLGGQLVAGLTGLLRSVSQDFLRQLAGPLARYVLRTPDLLGEPTLRHYWLLSLSALLACIGLLLAASGLGVTTGDTGLGRAARLALAVRLPSCTLTAAMSLPLMAIEVQLANRLVDVFTTSGLDAAESPLWIALSGAGVSAGLAVVVTSAVGVALLVGLVVVGLARWATVWLLVILAPVAMGFAALPGGEPVARVWWRLQLATVFLPVANAVLLATYVALFSSARTGLIGALSGVAVLVLMAKIPSWVGGVAVGVEVRDVLYPLRRGSRAAGRLASVGRPAGRASGEKAAAA